MTVLDYRCKTSETSRIIAPKKLGWSSWQQYYMGHKRKKSFFQALPRKTNQTTSPTVVHKQGAKIYPERRDSLMPSSALFTVTLAARSSQAACAEKTPVSSTKSRQRLFLSTAKLLQPMVQETTTTFPLKLRPNSWGKLSLIVSAAATKT